MVSAKRSASDYSRLTGSWQDWQAVQERKQRPIKLSSYQGFKVQTFKQMSKGC